MKYFADYQGKQQSSDQNLLYITSLDPHDLQEVYSRKNRRQLLEVPPDGADEQ